MTADMLASSLDARRVGSGWMARCPAHDDRTPSLSISAGADNRPLVHCHAGCEQARLIAELRRRGLWPRCSPQPQRPSPRRPMPGREGNDIAMRRHAALELWSSAQPAAETLVERYLETRHLRLPIPETLRFHPALRHPSGRRYPAMVALVTHGITGAPLAVHRTFLTPNGCGKAPVTPAKMMLGPCRGGVVRLGVPPDRLVIGEGIETSLAGMMVTSQPAWAALSASGMTTLELPSGVREVLILADGDEAGEAAAQSAAGRWSRSRTVRIARAPKGRDFNDLLNELQASVRGGER